MATIDVKDAAGATVAIEKPLTPGRAAAASSRPVALSNEDLAAVQRRSSAGTQTSVAGSASDGTILASNSDRIGAAIYNDSTAILYLLLASGTSSSSAFTVKMQPDAYYEVPAGYTGVIKGIWASATGNARVTEWA